MKQLNFLGFVACAGPGALASVQGAMFARKSETDDTSGNVKLKGYVQKMKRSHNKVYRVF